MGPDRTRLDSGIDARGALTLLAAGPHVRTPSRTVTYSRNIAIPVTRICRNRCAYCSFAESPGRAAPLLLAPGTIRNLLRLGAASGCTEALFLTGERPEQACPAVGDRLAAWGYRDLVDYLVHMGEAALDHGLLPHTNAGVLDRDELNALRGVNASLGLMLESASDRLCRNGGAHARSPGKRPAVRLRTIEEAGKLGIPFTTGILIGIGEKPEERVDALRRIRELHSRYGHIQEVIVQPFCPKPGTPMSSHPAPPAEDVLAAVACARRILGPDLHIQVPPNLVPSLDLFIRAGADDWGGLSPLTADPVNPENGWPDFAVLRKSAEAAGAMLRERLPVYPEFITDRHLPPRVRCAAAALVDGEGYVKGDRGHGPDPQEH